MEINESSLDKKIGEAYSLLNKLSTDSTFKIIIVLTIYGILFLFALLAQFKFYQQNIFGLRFLDLPTWPEVDSVSALTDEFYFYTISMTLFFTIFFSLHKRINDFFSDSDVSVLFQPWVMRFRLNKILRMRYLRILLVILAFILMYKTSGGLIQFICLFMVNELGYQFFLKKEEKDNVDIMKATTIGGLLLHTIFALFGILIIFIYLTIAIGFSAHLKKGVSRLVCAGPQLASVRIEENEHLSGWVMGQNLDYLSIRRKDSNNLYETISINKNKIVNIVYLSRYESKEERINAFPNCADNESINKSL